MSGQARWGDLMVAGDTRRRKLRERHGNGLDGVEVREEGRRLIVFFLDHAPRDLHPGNLRIEGPPGARTVRAVEVRRFAEVDRELEDRLVVELDGAGPPGPHRLRLVERKPDGRPGWAPYHGVDPRFAEASFVFDVDAPVPPIARTPPGAPASEQDISYLGRDYEGLRQLMLDRLTETVPAWTERHVPDVWVTLVELLAYVGDDLSYYGDAVATEAYLQTARRRVSIRRHGRLLDYRLHDGCNARAWVCVEVDARLELPLHAIRFAAVGRLLDDRRPRIDASSSRLAKFQQYTPLPAGRRSSSGKAKVTLHPAHNAIELWSWGEPDSCLVAGATHAVLVDGKAANGAGAGAADAEGAAYGTRAASTESAGYGKGAASAERPAYGEGAPRRRAQRTLQLSPGDMLVLEEHLNPAGGGGGGGGVRPADPTHRQAVRLTEVRPLFDELYEQALLEVSWAPEDALQFDLAVTSGGLACSRASGNVLLVAHGVAVEEELHPSTPPSTLRLTRSQLGFSAAFPDPEVVARHQARRLRALYKAWRRQLEEWRTEAAHGTPLSAQRLQTLRDQLGEEALEDAGLTRSEDEESAEYEPIRSEEYGEDEPVRSEGYAKDEPDEARVLRALRQADGLADLLAHADRLLVRRRRRAEVLAGLAEASGPLDDVLVHELEDDWGRALVAALAPGGPGAWVPAARVLAQDPRTALPVLELADGVGADRRSWPPALDLIGVTPSDRAVVADVDDEGIASLRISPPPPAGECLVASYWVGNGASGNAPAEAINAIVWLGNDGALGAIKGVRNPLPASGGIDPQDGAAAKRAIPGSFLERQPRALSPEDYAALAASHPGVRRAAAELRFTGSLTVADVAVQPVLGEDPRDELLAGVRRALESPRRIGHVLRVRPPRYRPLLIALDVSLAGSALRAVVADQLAALLSSGWLPDGTPALFNPAKLDFGKPVYSSPVIAIAGTVDGVESAVLTRFGFLGDPAPATDWKVPEALILGTLELPRLDNDPAAPQHGYALASLEGGR